MSNKFSRSKKQAPSSSNPPHQGTALIVPSHVIAHSTPCPPSVPVQDWPDNDDALFLLGDPKTGLNSWGLRDAFEGVQVFGGTGSGKTSGSGKTLAKAFLQANLGGLILTAKRDEAEMWQQYAIKLGREKDVVIFPHTRDGQKVPLRFNFLRYAYKRDTGRAGATENLVNLFCSVIEVAERKSQGGGADGYWQRAMKQLLRNAIDLCILATGTVELEILHEIVYTAPSSLEAADVKDPTERLNSVCLALIDAVADKTNLTPLQLHDFKLTRDFWEKEFPGLAVETRSGVVSTFTTMADCFLRGQLYDLFCTDLNIFPEECWEDAKIIILDLPVKEFYELGQYAQVIFKYLWQRSVEQRVGIGLGSADAQRLVRPVFLWADEAQFFANSYDAQFQSTARSSRACTVYLTQNLPSYHAVFGGANSKAEADMFLGNLVTKIFHANGDSTTNQWAADTIGKQRQFFFQAGNNNSVINPKAAGTTAGMSENISYAVEPQEFTKLRRGGGADLRVDGIIFQGGRTWQLNGATSNFMVHSFDQTIL